MEGGACHGPTFLSDGKRRVRKPLEERGCCGPRRAGLTGGAGLAWGGGARSICSRERKHVSRGDGAGHGNPRGELAF